MNFIRIVLNILHIRLYLDEKDFDYTHTDLLGTTKMDDFSESLHSICKKKIEEFLDLNETFSTY